MTVRERGIASGSGVGILAARHAAAVIPWLRPVQRVSPWFRGRWHL